MLYAAVLQHYLFKLSPCHDNEPSECKNLGQPLPAPLNVWIVAGPYILVGMSEIFASITSLEYAFTKVGNKKNENSILITTSLVTGSQTYEISCDGFRPIPGRSVIGTELCLRWAE